jgi:serine/threonine protein kinase
METRHIETKPTDEGTHGCVYSPKLPCKKGKPDIKGKRTVGKILVKKNSDIELSMATILMGIPGWERYYVVSEGDNCTSHNFSEMRNQYARQCKIFQRADDDNLVQLISPYAGTTVYRMGLTGSFDYLGSLRHMLEAVSKLEKQGICHFDLHANNVLVDYRGTFRIIDFGAAFIGDDINDKVLKRHLYDFSPQFPPQPPELSVQNGIYAGMDMNESVKATMQEKKEFSLAQRFLGINVESQERNLRNFWAEDTTWNGDSWVPFFKAYWRKWDSWAVGVMFLDLLQKSFLLTPFIENTWKQYSVLIRKCLTGLLQSEPMARMTAAEALALFQGV